MKLNLTFKEKEIRDLYNESFKNWDIQFNERIQERNKTTIVLSTLTLFFIGLIYFHTDWIYYSIFFLVITITFILWTLRLKWKNERKVNKDKRDVDEYLEKYRTIDNIKYDYDDKKIRYYELNTLKVEIDWDDFLSVDNNDQWIYLFFRDSQQNIWIPRVTVDKEEIKLFEQAIELRLQNAR